MKNYEICAAVGFALVLFISLLYGFREMLAEAVNHVIKDLTAELTVHAYIAGLILIFYALYLYSNRRRRKK